jgi:RNA binding exosome subunit
MKKALHSKDVVQQIQNRIYRGSAMSFHRVNIRTSVSSLMDEEVTIQSLKWLLGTDVEIIQDRTTSYHGARLQVLSAELKRKKDISFFFSMVKPIFDDEFLQGLDQRIDDAHVVHFRLDADALIEKNIVAHNVKEHHIIKCEAKLEVYPQQTPIDIFLEYIKEI